MTFLLKNVVRFTDRLDMTIIVDWDVKQQTKQMSQLMRLWYLSHRRKAKAQAKSEGSGEPAHPHRLARAVAVRTHKEWK